MPSAIDLTKRALVILLKSLVASYGVVLNIQRDSPDRSGGWGICFGASMHRQLPRRSSRILRKSARLSPRRKELTLDNKAYLLDKFHLCCWSAKSSCCSVENHWNRRIGPMKVPWISVVLEFHCFWSHSLAYSSLFYSSLREQQPPSPVET